MIRLGGGDIRFLGWDVHAELKADQYDQMLAIFKGLAGGSVEPEDRYPRPDAHRSSRAEVSEPGLFAPTIADFDVGSFMGIISKS